MINKHYSREFYLICIIWIMIFYDTTNRWELINSEYYFILEFFIYLFIFVTAIMVLTWGKRNNAFKTRKFQLISISILSAFFFSYFHLTDIVKMNMDFIYHYQERKEIAVRLANNYRKALRTEEYPDSLINIGEENLNLSRQGYVDIWNDRGCIEIDFQIFDGSGHGYVDFFNYGKSGHISYVTEPEKYNLKGGTIRDHIISTRKIIGKWYFTLTKY